MKKIFKIYYVLPAVLILLLIFLFAGWHFIPVKKIDIIVIDKTVPASKIDRFNELASDYRKHIGLFWLINEERYRKSDNSKYNYKTDYYGPILGINKQVEYKKLTKLEKTPNLVYISDGYGDQDNVNDEYKGITYQDLAVVSEAYQNGSMVIGEFNITSKPTEQSVVDEMQSMFGVKYSEWSGRYVADLSDLTDIPSWAVDLHEREYGRLWDYKGQGLILVSDSGEIIVFQQGVDYASDIFTINITDPYIKEFGKINMNFYNWFHLVESEYGTDVIAEFRFNLNETGKGKFSKISTKLTFPAVTKKNSGKADAYYFSGDFNDYVADERFYQFIGAFNFYNLFSYDRPGDITNFYWKFYSPLMKTLLKKAAAIKPVNDETNTASAAKLNNGKFEIQINGEWKALTLKGFNINASMPGSAANVYTRDISIYNDFIAQIASMNGNCIRVYDLLPPEFYRALTEYNNVNTNIIYFIQTVKPPKSISSGQYTGESAQAEMKKQIELVINAVHGKAVINEEKDTVEYINDASKYLIGYIGDLNISTNIAKDLNSSNYKFNGQYLEGDNGSTSAMAFFCDYICDYQQKQYNYIIPVGAKGNAALISGAPWSVGMENQYDINKIKAVNSFNQFFLAYSLQPTDTVLLDNIIIFEQYKDSEGNFAYGGYINSIKNLQTSFPILIDKFGVSTNSNSFNESLMGKGEQEQGSEIVRMHKVILTEGFIGAFISDFNDTWSGDSSVYSQFTIPLKNNTLWKNILDITENTGVYSVEPKKLENIGMSLKDLDRMTETNISCDEAYIYMTILLSEEINYDKEQLIIGLDTYQRNNGEYLYDPKFYATSLSGMEFVVKFESKNTAALYVIPSYNASKGFYSSKESYSGKFDYLSQMKYGTFENSNSNFYLTGSTLHIRLPWNLLNFTDPSNHLVINDTRTAAEIAADPFGLQVSTTEGIIFSLLIADKSSNDTLYLFPLTKQANGYKTYSWNKWEKPAYQFRTKESMNVISKYFKGN